MIVGSYAVCLLQALPDEIPLQVRIGINVGPVAAAVIGTRTPRYNFFGETMLVAGGGVRWDRMAPSQFVGVFFNNILHFFFLQIFYLSFPSKVGGIGAGEAGSSIHDQRVSGCSRRHCRRRRRLHFHRSVGICECGWGGLADLWGRREHPQSPTCARQPLPSQVCRMGRGYG